MEKLRNTLNKVLNLLAGLLVTHVSPSSCHRM